MTQEKKQTAVEFYLEKDTVLTIAFLQNKDKISQLEFLKAKFEIFDKALAMEREQIEEAHKWAHNEYGRGLISPADEILDEDAKLYYKFKYGKEAGHE